MMPLALLDAAFCWQITLALVQVGWLGIGIVGLALMSNWLLRKAPANCRYWANFAAMLFLALCLPVSFTVIRLTSSEPLDSFAPPVAASISPSISPSLAPSVASSEPSKIVSLLPARDVLPPDDRLTPSPAHTKTAAHHAESEPRDASAVPPNSQTSYGEFHQRDRSLAPYIATLYALGVVAMLFRLTVSVYGGQRLRAACRPVTDSRLLEIVTRQARRLGFRLIPALTCCHRVAVPMVIGVIRPVIVLPVAMIAGIPPEQFSAVLTHELAHLRRFDHLLILVQRILEAVVFFHPAVWYLTRRVQRERENCCDDLVLASGVDRLDFAQSLLRIAEFRLATASPRQTLAGLAVDGPNPSWLRRRIARLLDAGEEPGVRLTRSGLLTAVLAFLLSGAERVAPLQPCANGNVGTDTRHPCAYCRSGHCRSGYRCSRPKGGNRRKGGRRRRLGVRWPWRVVDGETGKPLSGVMVAAHIRKPSPPGYGRSVPHELLETFTFRSDANGRFFLVLPERLRKFSPVMVRVSAAHEGYATNIVSEEYEFRPEETVNQPTLELFEGVPLSGRILNPDGTPAVRLCIRCRTALVKQKTSSSQIIGYVWTYTDDGGRFKLTAPRRGITSIFLRPPKALRVMHTIGETRGSIADIRLESGLSIRGQVFDPASKPLSYVSVVIHPVGAGDGDFRAMTDAQGRFELPPQLPGEYLIQPVPDLVFDGQMPAEQLPESYRKYLLPEDDVCVQKPLPATFTDHKVTLLDGQPVPEVELKAVPHVTLRARFVDRHGNPAPPWSWDQVGGSLDGQRWEGRFQRVPGKPDTIKAIVPRGLKNVDVQALP